MCFLIIRIYAFFFHHLQAILAETRLLHKQHYIKPHPVNIIALNYLFNLRMQDLIYIRAVYTDALQETCILRDLSLINLLPFWMALTYIIVPYSTIVSHNLYIMAVA